MRTELINEECICGHSGDGKCHCCESEHFNDVYEETDMDEFVEQLEDWD